MLKKMIMTLLAAVGLGTACSAGSGVEILLPKVFAERAKADSTAIILDVRTPEEYSEGHLKGAILLDWLNEEAFGAGVAKLDKAHTYYLYCRSGRRSHAAAGRMHSLGFRVYDMQGGILSWMEQKMPVTKD